jgi:predicted RNA-binding Zn-ribbon protein involved in translation (DUF1610 family)
MPSIIEDIPQWDQPCNSPEHNPPTHICIPYGKQLKHTCPKCGSIMIIRGADATL